MKLQQKLIFLLAIVFLATSISMGGDALKDNSYEYQKLMDTASQKGFVRVIVKLDVPHIKELTSLSTAYKTGDLHRPFAQFAYDADLELDTAISNTRSHVLMNMNGTHFQINRKFATIPYVGLTVTPEALDRLRSLPGVITVNEDKRYRRPVTTQVQQGNEDDLSAPKLGTSTTIVGADKAWGFGHSGEGWYVAVLDTGLRTSHEMFKGKNIVEQCYALGEDWYDKVNGGCPNGGTEMSGPGSAAPYAPQYSHGTHVAGIAAGNDTINGSYGVARGAGLLAINVFTYFPLENDVLSWTTDQLKGLEYVYQMRNTYNIAAANMSLGGSTQYGSYCTESSRAAAVANLRAAGIATVISSGNDGACGTVSDPACIPGAVTVSGTDKSDGVYTSGNWNDLMVDLLAPGVSINSSLATGDDSYGALSGTSMSSPHVTGAWAILKAYDPNLTFDEIFDALKNNGPMITNTRCSGMQPKPRIDVGAALSTLFAVAPPANVNVEQQTNKSFLQTEYINEVSWEINPLNANKDVTGYKVYLVNGSQLTLLSQVGNTTFNYWHRNVEKRAETTYALSAIDANGDESPPFYYTIKFGTSQ